MTWHLQLMWRHNPTWIFSYPSHPHDLNQCNLLTLRSWFPYHMCILLVCLRYLIIPFTPSKCFLPPRFHIYLLTTPTTKAMSGCVAIIAYIKLPHADASKAFSFQPSAHEIGQSSLPSFTYNDNGVINVFSPVILKCCNTLSIYSCWDNNNLFLDLLCSIRVLGIWLAFPICLLCQKTLSLLTWELKILPSVY